MANRACAVVPAASGAHYTARGRRRCSREEASFEVLDPHGDTIPSGFGAGVLSSAHQRCRRSRCNRIGSCSGYSERHADAHRHRHGDANSYGDTDAHRHRHGDTDRYLHAHANSYGDTDQHFNRDHSADHSP
jgi:hypothetical protein